MLAFKGNICNVVEKLRTVDHGTFCKGVFGPKKALGPVEYGKKKGLFAKVYSQD